MWPPCVFERANGLVKRRGGCGAVPSTASMVVRVSPPIAAAIAASA